MADLGKQNPDPRANAEGQVEVTCNGHSSTLSGPERKALRAALVGDALATAARLAAINALAAESAAHRGDEAEVFARLRNVAMALDEAREVVRLAGRIAQ